MKLFSILQHAIAFQWPYRDGITINQTIELSQDPDDSSLVRLRATPPVSSEGSGEVADGSEALEIEFDRNGRERSRRLWPMKYPAWDKRDAADIDKAMAEAEEKAAIAVEAAKQETSSKEEPDELDALSKPKAKKSK